MSHAGESELTSYKEEIMAVSERSSAHRGPIRVSVNGRHFVDASGEPFFWLGDTAWPLFTSYSREDAEEYLSDRARKGFTVIQGVLAWGDPDPNVSLGGTPPGPNYAGHRPWHDSPAEPNEAFFGHVDYLIKFAAERGLMMGVLPTWGYNVNNARAFNEENAYVYGRWLGARYKEQPNMVWINGGDREPIGFEAVYRALAVGLREGDGGAHLITYHPCGWRSSSYYFHQEDWLDFNMIETWTAWPQVYPAIRADYGMLPVKPVVLGEGAYENGPEYPQGPITPLVVRRQAWWTFMAGGFFTYGQNQMWRMEPGWTSTFDTPGAGHMTQFKVIATSRPWWQMIPDQGLYAGGVSSERTLNAALRAVDRSCAMLYLSSQCHVLIYLDRIAMPKVRATWVNPQNGETLDGGLYDTGNGVEGSTFPIWTTQWFSVPPFWEDAVLILDGVE